MVSQERKIPESDEAGGMKWEARGGKCVAAALRERGESRREEDEG